MIILASSSLFLAFPFPFLMAQFRFRLGFGFCSISEFTPSSLLLLYFFSTLIRPRDEPILDHVHSFQAKSMLTHHG